MILYYLHETTIMPIDEKKMQEFLEKAIGDLGATGSSTLVVVGEKLGLYKKMADSDPLTAKQLSEKTGVLERYVSEWLNNQAAGGYVTYDPMTGKYSLTEEQAACLADENSLTYLPGSFQAFLSMAKDEEKIARAFKEGKGIPWGDHHCDLYEGTEKFFKTSYMANLVSTWIPSLEGVEEKLKNGALVADIGCGHGSSTIIMAKEYPKSTFVGFDYHPPSIETAKRRAQEAGVSDQIRFEVSESTQFSGDSYDFVTIFDALHDMADPYGTSKQIFKSLKSDGSWMIVEPSSSDKLEENHNPLGRMFYSASATVCVPCSIAGNGPALGAQAGPKKIQEVVKKGGFTRFRIATQNTMNIVYEAKP